MNKEDQLEVIKFLKSPEYTKVLKQYNNKYEKKVIFFETAYLGEDYKAGEPEYSENAMQAKRYKIFLERIEDVKGESRGADLVREMLQEQATNIKSNFMNAVTNSFGGSKDLAVFTEDDMYKYEMLHEKDFHIFIVGIMNGGKDDLSIQDKYDIYENPEDQLID